MSEHDTGPFDPWDSDHTALVHVLWGAKHKGLTIKENADEIATVIMRSRWKKARDHHVREQVIARLRGTADTERADSTHVAVADWLEREFPNEG